MRYKLRSCLWIPEKLIKREGPFYLFSLLLPIVWNEVMVAELQQPFWTQRRHEDESFLVGLAQRKAEDPGCLMTKGHS